jgi:hypothetical protein
MLDELMQSVSPETVRYERIAENVHEIVYLETSRRAVDEGFIILDRIHKHYAQIDSESGLQIGILLNTIDAPTQPVAYFFSRVREYRQKWQSESSEFVRDSTRVRVVVLYDPEASFIMNLFSTFNAALRWKQVQVRYIKAEDRENALEWLRFVVS